MKMLDPNLAEGGKTHNDVKLSREELDKFAAWLDMLVPAFGDYEEGGAWDEADKRKFAYYEAKSADMKEFDLLNNQQFVAWQRGGELPPLPQDLNAYRNVATNPKVVDAAGWRVNFDKPVNTDQVVISFPLRGDALSSPLLRECTIECSNGFRQRAALKSTGDFSRLVFTFPVQRNVEWIRLSEFNPALPAGWIDSVEAEVYGIDN